MPLKCVYERETKELKQLSDCVPFGRTEMLQFVLVVYAAHDNL